MHALRAHGRRIRRGARFKGVGTLDWSNKLIEANSVNGGIRWLLRIEGLAILILSIYAYSYLEFSWVSFFVFFLVPDISFIGYLISSKVGAIFYNITHSLIGAALCLGLGVAGEKEIMLIAGVIWFAHIGFDRALGYGLKYNKGFSYTHLGRIGKNA